MKITRLRIHYLPPLVFVGLSLTILFATWAFEKQDAKNMRAETLLVAEQSAKRLEEFMRSRLFVIKLLGEAAQSGEIGTNESFEAYAQSVLNNFDGLHAISCADPAGFVHWVYPLEGNQEALGSNFFGSLDVLETRRFAGTDGRVEVTPPQRLPEGELVSFVYLPLLTGEGLVSDGGGRIAGYVGGTFRLDSLFTEVLADGSLDGYEIWIQDGEHYIYGSERDHRTASAQGFVAQANVGVQNRTWLLKAMHRPPGWDFGGAARRQSFLVLGLLLAAAVSFSLYFWIERQRNR